MCVCVSTRFMPGMIKLVGHGVATWQTDRYGYAMPWRGDSVADCQGPCKVMALCNGMVTCHQRARYLYDPSSLGQTRVKSVLRCSFPKAQQGPYAKPLVESLSVKKLSWAKIWIFFFFSLIHQKMRTEPRFGLSSFFRWFTKMRP